MLRAGHQYSEVWVAKRASLTRFGPARFWPVENGPGRASQLREKRPETSARPVP